MLYHGLEKYLCGDNSACEVEAKHALELLGVEVEESLVGGDGGAGHVAAGGVEQGVYSAVALYDFLAVGFHKLAVHHICLDKLD